MAMTRWEPLEELTPLRDAVNRLFEETFVRPMRYGMLASTFPVDVYETETEYVVEAPLAGVKPEDIQVTAVRDTLTVHASLKSTEKPESKADKTPKTGYYVRRERFTGEMVRTIELPTQIEPEKVAATYEHGMLILRVPKAEALKPKQIAVRVKEPAMTH
jgi:HSP20 family protein